MIVHEDDLEQLKSPEDFKYKVYMPSTRSVYTGYLYIAAPDADAANVILNDFRKSDPDNIHDSKAAYDIVESNFYGKYSNIEGIVLNTLHYTG